MRQSRKFPLENQKMSLKSTNFEFCRLLPKQINKNCGGFWHIHIVEVADDGWTTKDPDALRIPFCTLVVIMM